MARLAGSHRLRDAVTAQMPLPDGSVATVTPHDDASTVSVCREIASEVVWGQVLSVRPQYPDEVAMLANWLHSMTTDPSAFTRWWRSPTPTGGDRPSLDHD